LCHDDGNRREVRGAKPPAVDEAPAAGLPTTLPRAGDDEQHYAQCVARTIGEQLMRHRCDSSTARPNAERALQKKS
jgi:hypothetical protein